MDWSTLSCLERLPLAFPPAATVLVHVQNDPTKNMPRSGNLLERLLVFLYSCLSVKVDTTFGYSSKPIANASARMEQLITHHKCIKFNSIT